MKTIEETYRERLEILIEEYGSQAALAKAINKSSSQISQWLTAAPDSKTGKPRSLKSDTAREIESAVGKPYAWFDQPVTDKRTSKHLKTNDDYICFERLEVVVALGQGITTASDHIEVVEMVTVARAWAKKNLGNNLSRIKVITATGDSMKGTIENGEVLFVDESVKHYDGEGIYVIHTPAGLKAKRLQMMINGSLAIISDNEKYKSEMIPYDELDTVSICGKVKGSWSLNIFNDN